jgi:hypothetical protein
MQSNPVPWLNPRRMRALTIAAMCAAGIVSTVGLSGSSVPAPQAHRLSIAAASR